MADETKKDLAGTNAPLPAPEPVILEEHVVASAPAEKAAPQPPQEKAAAVVSPPPAAVPTAAAPITPVASVPPPAPTIPIPPLAPVQSVPSPKTSEAPKELKSDIANILKGIKLPERRDSPLEVAKPQKEPKKFDTSLAGQALGDTATASNETPPAVENAPAIVTIPTSPHIVAPQATEKQSPGNVQAVHTLKNDLQNVVRDEKISVVRAVSLEENRRAHRANETGESPETRQRSTRTFAILFSVLLLVALGLAALFGVYSIAQQRSGAPAQQIPQSSILFAESSVVFPLDGKSADDLKHTLSQARTSASGALGSITRIIPTVATTSADGTSATRPATFAEFMNAIGAHPPDDLLRALDSNFFFGIHTVDKNAPILIVHVTSYAHAFAGMLAWEGTMNGELSPVFTQVPVQTRDANGLPTKRVFQDRVMNNYDTRVLLDDSGTVELYYSFPTQGILVIAQSPYSFTEILSRLQSGREL